MNSKQKGKVGERELAEYLRTKGFASARRGQQFKGTNDSPDVVCQELPYHIECKRVEKLNLRQAVSQVAKDSGGTPWVVFHRWNHGDWLVTVSGDFFLELAKANPA